MFGESLCIRGSPKSFSPKPHILSAPAALSRTVKLRNIAETLAFGAVGGLTFGFAGMPAGWLSGSILAVAAAALAGRPMFIPILIMRALLVVIGITLGAVVTPETLQGMATYPLSIAVLLVAMGCVSFAGSAYLRAVHGWDRVTAYLAAVPGGMSQVMAVGAELDSDLRAIAIVQTIRVVMVAVGLPAALLAFGFVGDARGVVGAPFDPAQFGELVILVVASTAMALIAYVIRFPGGLLFGAMLTSAALHGSDYIHVTVPWWIANTAMVGFGAVIGARFANTSLRLLLDFVAAALGSFAVALTVASVFAGGLLMFLDVPVAEVIIAYAPGSVDAMMLLALGLHLDPVYVGAHHLTRIFFVSLTMPLVARRRARTIARTDPTASDPIRKRQRRRFGWPFRD